MKYVVLMLTLMLLLAGCIHQVEIPEEIPSEIELPLSQLTDEEILEQYPDDLDDALAELDLLEVE